MTSPRSRTVQGHSLYLKSRAALDAYDAAVRDGRDDDRIQIAERMVGYVRYVVDQIEWTGRWAVLAISAAGGLRLLGTFGSEARAANWAAEHLPDGAEFTVLPLDNSSVMED